MGSTHAAFGFFIIGLFAVSLAIWGKRVRPLSLFYRLAVVAVILRVVGGLLRHLVIRGYYKGYGDAGKYYREGLDYASALHELDFDRFLSVFEGGTWWGTQFVTWMSGIILALIGPTWRGEFVFFALLGGAGCFCIAIAFYRSAPNRGRSVLRDYLLLLCLMPSMWFWPSSVGKEGLLLFGLGVAVLGYVGRNGVIQWFPLVVGVLFVFSIRPHVATVFLAGVMISEWFGRQQRLTPVRVLQAVLSLVAFVLILQQTTKQFGFSAVDLEGAMEFYQYRSGQTEAGGSQISGVGAGLGGVGVAYVNILFRPFIFEAHNIMALFSAFEITFLWVFAWRRRRRIRRALRNWRTDRFLRIGLPMTALYVLMIGLTFSNLGIIARQRVLILPFLFAVLVGKSPPARQPIAKEQSKPQLRPV